MSGIRTTLVTVGGLVALLMGMALLCPIGVHADEDQGLDRAALRVAVHDHVLQMRQHRRKNDVYGLAEDVWAIVRLHRDAATVPGSASCRRKMVRVVGILTRHPDERIRPVALSALGEMGDLQALEYVKPFLRPSRCAEIDRTTLAAIEAASMLRDESCVYHLLRILRLTDCPCEAIQAIRALGAFEDCGRHQEQILGILAEELGKQDSVLRTQVPTPTLPFEGVSVSVVPTTPRRCPVWEAAMKRAALVETLTRLTGRTFRAAEDWLRFLRKGDRPDRPRGLE